uniref:Uncharacterized protein n=1 Tax=Anguilla anguilla TaxID=7936 RepID=A0A0E9RE10_ANGAN
MHPSSIHFFVITWYRDNRMTSIHPFLCITWHRDIRMTSIHPFLCITWYRDNRMTSIHSLSGLMNCLVITVAETYQGSFHPYPNP